MAGRLELDGLKILFQPKPLIQDKICEINVCKSSNTVHACTVEENFLNILFFYHINQFICWNQDPIASVYIVCYITQNFSVFVIYKCNF